MLMLYDGHCSVCAASARSVEKLDRGRGRIRTVDFRRSLEEASAAGISSEQLEASLHTIARSGQVSRGPDAVREAIRSVGLGPLACTLSWPIIGGLFGACYDVFARNRLRWFGIKPDVCNDGRCPIDSNRTP